jgi:flagellar motor switch protein FliG
VSDLDLSGVQKAAALLITLGPAAASQILKFFQEEEIEQITYEISRMSSLSNGVKEAILAECYHMSFVSEGVSTGGLEYVRDMISLAL